MTARLHPDLPPQCEFAWNAISRAWDEFSGPDSKHWPKRRAQFARGLREQLVTMDQGKEFYLAATKAIALIETSSGSVRTKTN